ncbi:O-antigen ligase family protein [Microbacterium pumilum]|uniref:O-antigen ligase-related domain-containing protein n=1 Tax=Microbacterium pumilum TaxID=344165 RepID=A0ABN2S229_9MICO
MTTALPQLTARTTSRIDAVGWLTVYLVLLLFVPSRLIVGPLGSAGAPSMLFGLGSLLLWLLLFLGAARRAASEPQPIRIALALLLFFVGVSYILAMSRPMSPDETSPGDVALLALASWSGTLLLTHDGIHERSRLDTLIWRFTVCGGLIAVLGLIQVATRQLWVDQLSIPGLSSAPAYGLTTRGGYPRPAGTSIHPIEYGVLLAMILPLALHVGFNHTHRGPVIRWIPAIALIAIIPLTSSRSAYLGAAIGLVICMIGWTRRRRLRVLAIGAAGVLAMLVITPNFFGAIVGLFTGAGEDPSIASRTDSFSLAFEFISQNPAFGRGLGTFLPKYRIFDNQYLLLLVTIGVVGTIAFLALGITAAVTMLRLRVRLRDEGSRDLALALTASICAGFSCLFMFDAFAFPMTMGTLFVTLGICGALRRIEDAKAGLAALLR